MVEDKDKLGMCGMNVACIQLFFSFRYNGKEYSCALTEWFSRMVNCMIPIQGCGRFVQTSDMVSDCYGFEYSKDNPKNIDSQQVPSFQGSRFKDSENSLVKEFVSRIEPMF